MCSAINLDDTAISTGSISITTVKQFQSAALTELVVEEPIDESDLNRLENPLPCFGGKSGQKFSTNLIFKVSSMPMYPMSCNSMTNAMGTLYDVDLGKMSPSEREALHTCIAYSHQETGSGNVTNVAYQNAGRMWARTFTCRGVKLCTGLHPSVKHRHLGGASAEILLQQNAALSKQFAGAMPREVPDDFLLGPATNRLDARQKAYVHAQEIEDRVIAGMFCTHVSSDGRRCPGLPIVHHVRDTKTTPELDHFGREIPPMTWVLNCTEWRFNKKDNSHYTLWNLEIFFDVLLFKILLDKIVKNGALSSTPVYFCSAIHHFASKKQKCKQLHGTSQCKIIPSEETLGGACPVKFTLLTPVKNTRNQNSAYLFVYGGYHNHAPPPPDKTPRALWRQITATIARLGPNSLHDLKPLKITNNTEVMRLLHENDAETLENLHPSLKPDVVAGLIYRQRVVLAPEGRSFGAVVAAQRIEQTIASEERYVRCATIESNCSFVICFTHEGAKSLYSTEYIEVDLASKRVKGAFNEMEVVTFAENPPRTITHARIFMDKESHVAYEIAFRLLFDTLARELKLHVLTFHHLNPNTHLHALVSDFDTKQAVGMGRYLQSVDPENRCWNWQISQIVRYCKVHFKRGIDMKYSRSHPAHGFMNALLRCKSVSQYYTHLNSIESRWPDTRGWCQHKRRPDIAAGLISSASGINDFVWARIPDHTNAGESSHNASNQGGTRLTLMSAIDFSRKMDRRQACLARNFITFGSQPTQRQKTVTTHLSNAKYQQGRREANRKVMEGSIVAESTEQANSEASYGNILVLDPSIPTAPSRNISSSGSPRGKC
ncbi:Putative uncharacterized protein [Taphrina deformans PYCC 5710]|uniref:Uncharacterized protein n=1 Tax=Taphrina deformans (strain PYCC 5710 / ATCC 11124 / CBS 356.35 / IMI 108563 / JCM 9778 / NBRC 8474) TaxID=1097556 RepID=R4X690_TAPDE|nr:Putative uncharacterized protein [Taphrina deformans PYCC 5710]|eukprot:CCG80504.1 Putative uncharacterized protein [Taphrina deformans PYCC 5710]